MLLQVRGKKILILDCKVSGFLGLIAEVPLLKEHGVDRYEIVPYLDSDSDPTNTAGSLACVTAHPCRHLQAAVLIRRAPSRH